MAKKIKKRPTGPEPVDPNLEEVGEERAFEIELDEEMNEIVIVNHYRRSWGDEFDADVEHGLNLKEAKDLMNVLYRMTEALETKAMLQAATKVEEKSSPCLIEKNPLKDNPVQ